MQKDVIIIGAGIAGLMAAHTLKQLKLSYAVLEAAPTLGGRAQTHCTASGMAADLGAHWLHGKDNPLKELLEHYGLGYKEDKADQGMIFHYGKKEKTPVSAWIDKAIDKHKSAQISKGALPDCALPDLAVDEKAREILTAFARMWDGLSPPLMPSAWEFLIDQNAPGGLQVEGGIASLVNKLADDIGREHILTGKPVQMVASRDGYATAALVGGEKWQGKKILFTGSLGVIQSGHVAFEPALSPEFRNRLAQIAMGDMNRITVEVSPGFLEECHIPENLSLQLLDGYPHFCHVRGAGLPLISLFVAGSRAREVERFSPRQAMAYISKVLAPATVLAGFEQHVVGSPILSRWSSNPYICGSYSSCLPGGRRTTPHAEGNIYFCGDTFDTQFPGSMAGASRSGRAAAILAAKAIRHPALSPVYESA